MIAAAVLASPTKQSPNVVLRPSNTNTAFLTAKEQNKELLNEQKIHND